MGEDGQQYLDLIFYARAMAWRNALDGYESEALRTVLATLDAGRAEILREFAARYSTVTDWSAERMQAVIEEMEAMTAGLRKDMTAQYADLTVAAAGPSIAEASAALSVGGLVNVNTVGISSSQLRSFFLETPLGGNTIQNWVDRSFGATVQAEMRQALNVGVLKGEGYRPLVKRIEQGFGMARNEATTLTRTFVSSANAESRRMVYEANRDIVTGWKWLTAGDNFVCILCLPLHGQKFKLGEGPTMPRHPRCRCASVPATVTWRELGIPMDELRAEADRWVLRGKVGQDGEISVKPIGTGGANEVLRVGRFKDADAWWSSLSDAEKRATSVGPGRAKLLDEGKIGMKDLVGADFKPRTLKELEGVR